MQGKDLYTQWELFTNGAIYSGNVATGQLRSTRGLMLEEAELLLGPIQMLTSFHQVSFDYVDIKP